MKEYNRVYSVVQCTVEYSAVKEYNRVYSAQCSEGEYEGATITSRLLPVDSIILLQYSALSTVCTVEYTVQCTVHCTVHCRVQCSEGV